MGTGYLEPGNALYPLDIRKACVQTFKLPAPIMLHWVDATLRTWLAFDKPWVQVFAVDENDEPTGDFFSHSVAEDFPKALPGATIRARWRMDPCQLHADTTYALVMRQSVVIFEVPHEWRYQKETATYPSGHRQDWHWASSTWRHFHADDHIFYIFGTPTTPPPPPDPPIKNFMIIDIQQYLLSNGFMILILTNVPCHLTMHWTTIEPKTHKVARVVRGLPAPEGAYFCFDVQDTNEQEEDGDTLYHSFIKRDWPLCQTRYFAFTATINEIESPSSSPIFSKHMKEPSVPSLFFETWTPPPEIIPTFNILFTELWSS